MMFPHGGRIPTRENRCFFIATWERYRQSYVVLVPSIHSYPKVFAIGLDIMGDCVILSV